MARMIMALILGGCIGCTALPQSADAQDAVALRRKCAHLVKVKLGIKETGNVNDLQGVRGAVAMVDRCVANKGKLD